ncbi:short-chain dehydrogenase/reductase [Actinosynnema mirum]|uniref:Short-chain dehydrogenase/reductase SDR n=1 Tax=Actinosynnema mirum (strain ATCC 29888 / DSM 43827 / JCM 3225 / NBRC 14064 / NCIMB 13271 / NRRL B-12336 / IMRU 3971 / 101) TaxID=446462 RepID=C6WR22_ACTMD|nr:short-chain dehydrogenase/reductase [Actinosynnema mirum]ACU40715.1 short-chain dehydrogenase/reductase SDR [Actinosynnema mirum DSM 43827]
MVVSGNVSGRGSAGRRGAGRGRSGKGVTDQVVLITGAARGIGADTARRLAARGARVALVGLEGELLREVARECGGQAWEADVTDAEALRAAVDAAVAHYGRLDAVIANAGVAAAGFARSMDPEVFERVIEVNLLGVWRTVRACLPHLVESRGYCLVVSSLAAIAHVPGNAAYSAAKAGCEAFADSLRAEVRHLGVDVGVAYFSWVSTDMVNGVHEHPVVGPLRRSLPGPAGRVHSVEAAGKALVRAVAGRSTSAHAPRWVALAKLVRGVLPGLVTRRSAGRMAEADRLMAEADSSGLVGPGGAAAGARE